MKTKKLNTFTLSGLIIGPILGSGIILLPPLLYDMVGDFSLIVWISILFLGFIFALIFGKLSIMYPGDGGVSLATREAMGKEYQLLTSVYLIFAVLFGPVAVLLIASNFIMDFFPDCSREALALYIYIFTYILLLLKIEFIGRLMLLVSSVITVIFFVSSIHIIINVNEFIFQLPNLGVRDMGHSFLIVFWAIVGWEIIGNYSEEVKDKNTLIRAVVFSAIIISLVYLVIAISICFGNFPKDESFKLVWLMEPLFGKFSNIILTLISTALCIGTLILFVGAVSRLISFIKISKYTSKHLKNGTPIGALNLLSFVYCLLLLFVHLKYLSLKNLVAFSDGFFISNAIIGLITGIILLDRGFLKIGAIVLTVLFMIILLFSNLYILAIIISLFLFVFISKALKRKRK